MFSTLTFILFTSINNLQWSSDIEEYQNQLREIALNSSKMSFREESGKMRFGSSPVSIELMPINIGNFIVWIDDENPETILDQLDNTSHLTRVGDTKTLVGTLTPITLGEMLDHPSIKQVEMDWRIELDRIKVTDKCVPWGLDRLDNTMDCLMDTGNLTGRGTHIYILDTGINLKHKEFSDRIGESQNFVDSLKSRQVSDCHGHGSHVAGIAGGRYNGVAKDTILHSVKVLDCSGYGYTSWIIEGLYWVEKKHKTTWDKKCCSVFKFRWRQFLFFKKSSQ